MVKQIELTQGKFALVDDEDFEYLNQFKWFASKNPGKNFPDNFMARRNIPIGKGRQGAELMHRVIMKAQKGEKVDHWNFNELDNRRSNLRKCTQSQNCANKRVKSRELPRGVSYCKREQRYLAQIQVEKKNKHLGYFDDPALASAAYQRASRVYHGEFSILNAA
jgi:HNH endonuclease